MVQWLRASALVLACPACLRAALAVDTGPEEDAVVASLQREADWLGREIARLRAETGAGLPDRRARCGRTLFLTLCMGTEFFDKHCGPLFASFKRAYGEEVQEQRLVAFCADVEPRLLEAAQRRFSPWGRLEAFELGGRNYPLYEAGASSSWGVECRRARGLYECSSRQPDVVGLGKSGANTLIKFRQAAGYLSEHGHGFDCAVVMDSDVLFVNPLGRSLAALAAGGPGAWDVALAAYDGGLVVPWAQEASAIGMTKRGFTRINAGVVLLSLRDLHLAQQLLLCWARASELLLTGGLGGPNMLAGMWKAWQQELMDEFVGNDPAALVLLLSSYAVERLPSLLAWGRCEACARAVEADLRLFEQEPSMPIRFRALPARILNHAESMPNGTFPPDLAIVHLKGPWWRSAVMDGVLYNSTSRTAAWNRDALALYSLAFHGWQLALPPDLRGEAFISLRAASCGGAGLAPAAA